MRSALCIALAFAAGCSSESEGGDLSPAVDMARSFDFAHGDLAAADAAKPGDLATPGDSSAPSDLTVLPDLIGPVDLTAITDLTALPDLIKLPDQTVLADLTALPDLTQLPDLSCNAAKCVTPPANSCNGAVATVYPNPGSCDNNGNCVYPPMVTNCANGCFGGFCTDPFVSLGKTTAAQGNTAIALAVTTSNGSSTQGGPAAHTSAVTVTAQTTPGGTTQRVTLIWSLDPTMAAQNQNPVAMTLTNSTLFTDTWSGQIPAQAAGVEVYFFLDAHPYNGNDAFDPNGFGIHYAYAVN